MDRRRMRAFSFGIFLTVSIIGSYYYYFNQKIYFSSDFDLEKKHLEKQGYIVIKNQEYLKLQKSAGVRVQGGKSNSSKISNGNVPARFKQDELKNEYLYHLVIMNGMNSDQIVHLLFQQKIIANEKDFGQFLISKQYEKKLQLGSYDVSSKMSFDQLAKTITKTGK
ncbi:MAG: hypothetical protein Q8898_07955 [Bacillota bacterium]|nr:hypothetical protein [Bacillota bacterium]